MMTACISTRQTPCPVQTHDQLLDQLHVRSHDLYQNCDARTVSHSCDASFQVCSALDAMIGSDSAPDIVLDLTTAGEHRLIFLLSSSLSSTIMAKFCQTMFSFCSSLNHHPCPCPCHQSPHDAQCCQCGSQVLAHDAWPPHCFSGTWDEGLLIKIKMIK